MKIFYGIITAVVIALIGAFSWLWGLNVLHWVTASWRESTAFWFFAVIAIIALVAAIVFYLNDKLASTTVFGVVTAGFLITGIVLGIGANHNILKNYYENSTEKVSADAPDYDDRSPYEVAAATSSNFLQDATGEASYTKSISNEGENGYWNTLVKTRGPFAGYDSVQSLDLPLYGTPVNSDVSFCNFNKTNTLRHNGSLPHNNMSRAIYGQVPLNVDFSGSDAYGFCNEDDEPIVVTPLKQIDGFFYPTWTFYGLALYNGETGQLTVTKDKDEVDSIPGPVYPISLAVTQRHSLAASEGWWEQVVSGTSGYNTASSNTEVQLNRSGEDSSDYVTTFTPRGASSSLVAVGHVSATDATPGELNTLTVSVLPEDHIRGSNSSLSDDIFTRYSYMPDFANVNLQVFEITSGKDGGWVASIGLGQAVNYRAYITPEGAISLYNSSGNLIAQGTSENGESGESGEGSTGLVPTDLSTLTPEELNELGSAIMDELAKRAQ